jgi:hypothetical protein
MVPLTGKAEQHDHRTAAGSKPNRLGALHRADVDQECGLGHWVAVVPTPYVIGELAACCKCGARGYDQRFKQLRVFDDLDPADVWPAWRVIADATRWGWRDPRGVNGLRQKAANVSCGSDINPWVNRLAVSHALTVAADALTCPPRILQESSKASPAAFWVTGPSGAGPQKANTP